MLVATRRQAVLVIRPYRLVMAAIVVAVAIFACLAGILPSAHAVPAWSRKTGLPCSSCHVGGSSRLNQMGRDFQQRGHRLQGDGDDVPGDRAIKPFDYASLSAKFRYSDLQSGTNSSQFQTGSLLTGGPLTSHVGFFSEYMWRDRLPNGKETTPGFMDTYAQYVHSPAADHFWWTRAGNLYPCAVSRMDGGGRLPLSRPHLITDSLGGVAPPLLRRSVGLSTGYYGGKGLQWEAGAVRADGADMLESVESFVSLERDFDEYGSGLGVFGRTGTTGADNRRFSQASLQARWMNARYLLTGAYATTWARDAANEQQRPDGLYLEAGMNVLTETTAFVRYDNTAGKTTAGPRLRGVVAGVTQRIPRSGRVVFELGETRSGSVLQHTFQMDVLLMY